MAIDRSVFRAELARRDLAQWKLARRLRIPASTLCDYIRGARPEPTDLSSRIERALRLAHGALTTRTATNSR